MTDKLIYILINDTQISILSVLTLNLINKQIKTQLESPTNRKTILQNFGDLHNKQPNVPYLPVSKQLLERYMSKEKIK